MRRAQTQAVEWLSLAAFSMIEVLEKKLHILLCDGVKDAGERTR